MAVRGTAIKGFSIPSSGAYWGADDSNGFTGASGIETLLGRTMAIRNRHIFWAASGAHIPTGTAGDATTKGVVPMVTWGSQGQAFPVISQQGTGHGTVTANGMGDIANGNYDTSVLKPFLTGLNNLGVPVLFRPWQEMDDSTNTSTMNCAGNFQGGIGTATNSNPTTGVGAGQTHYINAWRHLHDYALTLFPNHKIVFIWCPTLFDPDNNALSYYPGDAYVDIIGVDVYRQTFAGNVDPYYNFAVAHGKPFMVAEAGLQQGKTVKDPTTGTTYDKDASVTTRSLITKTQTDIESAKYSPNTIAYVTWNYNAGSTTNDLINTTTAALNQYKAWVNSSYWTITNTGGGGGGPVLPSGGSPSLSDDTPVTGEVLTCNPGSWSGTTPITFAYQWQVSATGTGGWSNATGSGNGTANYTVAGGDLAKFLRCQVTPSNSAGAGAAAFSEVTLPVASPTAGVPVNTAAPTITPTNPIALQTVVTTLGSWSNSPTGFEHFWQSLDPTTGTITTLPNSQVSAYTVPATLVGLQIRSQVLAVNGSGTSAAANSAWSSVITAAVVTPPPPGPVGPVKSPNPWMIVVTDRWGNAISNLTAICKQKSFTFTLNRPASFSFVVKSDDARVAGTHTDGFPYVRELMRWVRAYRYEQGQYVLRFAGQMRQIVDSGNADTCTTAVTCYDPMMALNDRLLRRMWWSPAQNAFYWTPTTNENTIHTKGQWPVYTLDPTLPGATQDDRTFVFDISNVDSINIATAIVDRANSIAWTGMNSAPINWSNWYTTQSNLAYSATQGSANLFQKSGVKQSNHFEQIKCADALVQLSNASDSLDFIVVPDESEVQTSETGFGGQAMIAAPEDVKQFGYLSCMGPSAAVVRSGVVLGYGIVPNNVATLQRSVDGQVWANALLGIGNTIQSLQADPLTMPILGVSENVVSASDVSIQSQLDLLTSEEVSITSRGQTLVTVAIQPGSANAFLPWDDFDLGDYVLLNAGRVLRGGFANGVIRAYGFTLAVDDDKGEMLTDLTLAPDSSSSLQGAF